MLKKKVYSLLGSTVFIASLLGAPLIASATTPNVTQYHPEISTSPSYSKVMEVASNGDPLVLHDDSVERFNPNGVRKAQYNIPYQDGAGNRSSNGLAEDSNGNIWTSNTAAFPPQGGGSLTYRSWLDKISVSGEVTQYELEAVVQIGDLTLANDGNIWVSATINPSLQTWGDVSERTVGFLAINSDGQILHTYPLENPNNQQGFIGSIAQDSSNNIWFATAIDNTTSKIGSISPTGEVQLLDRPDNFMPRSFIKGPDENIWFTESHSEGWSSTGRVGKITGSNTITTYPLDPNTIGTSMGIGPDGNLWLSQAKSTEQETLEGSMATIAANGEITTRQLFDSSFLPGSVDSGQSQFLWIMSAKWGDPDAIALSQINPYLFKVDFSDSASAPVSTPTPPRTGNTTILFLTLSSFLALLVSLILAKNHLAKSHSSR